MGLLSHALCAYFCVSYGPVFTCPMCLLLRVLWACFYMSYGLTYTHDIEFCSTYNVIFKKN